MFYFRKMSMIIIYAVSEKINMLKIAPCYVLQNYNDVSLQKLYTKKQKKISNRITATDVLFVFARGNDVNDKS